MITIMMKTMMMTMATMTMKRAMLVMMATIMTTTIFVEHISMLQTTAQNHLAIAQLEIENTWLMAEAGSSFVESHVAARRFDLVRAQLDCMLGSGKSDEEAAAALHIEVEVLKRAARHPHVVALHCVVRTPDATYLVMELMRGVELRVLCCMPISNLPLPSPSTHRHY